jgi:HSP20 family molecular chaperone IbpA
MQEQKKTDSRNNPRYRPASDILEREDGFHIFMDMPGVAKDDIELDLMENELIVSGKTNYVLGDGEKYIEVEFGNCEYRRTFTLSDAVDREKIKATTRNGVLELYLPKAEKTLPKKIEIKTG